MHVPGCSMQPRATACHNYAVSIAWLADSSHLTLCMCMVAQCNRGLLTQASLGNMHVPGCSMVLHAIACHSYAVSVAWLAESSQLRHYACAWLFNANTCKSMPQLCCELAWLADSSLLRHYACAWLLNATACNNMPQLCCDYSIAC